MYGPDATDARAWNAATIDEPARWYHELPARVLATLEESVRAYRNGPKTITGERLDDSARATCAAELREAAADLETGRGFVVFNRMTVERYSTAEACLAYWLLGQMLGDPAEQNVQGTLLYDVRDTGQVVASGVRFSVTNAESTFHTDNSFGTSIADYVGLLCLKAAKEGGHSQVVSGLAVHDEMRKDHARELETLYQQFHIDRRGGCRPGEGPTIQKPIIEKRRNDLVFRYLRYWIEVGHQKANEPLTPAQIRAMDTLDAVARRPEMRVEFDLQPGQAFFINNRWILHNRTEFQDYSEPDQRRHLVRLWLAKREFSVLLER